MAGYFGTGLVITETNGFAVVANDAGQSWPLVKGKVLLQHVEANKAELFFFINGFVEKAIINNDDFAAPYGSDAAFRTAMIGFFGTVAGVVPNPLNVIVDNFPATQDVNITSVTKEFFDSITDIFGRVTTAEPSTILDATHVFDAHTWMWTGTGTGTTSYNSTNSVQTITCDAGETYAYQTRRHGVYQPGKALVVVQTGRLATSLTDHTSSIGYYDENNGFRFQYVDGALSIVKRAFGSDVETVQQANWNVDPFDGTGPSGITIDPTKSNIFVTALQWLGVGIVALGLKIGKYFVPAHYFSHANVIEGTYMQSALLPCRWEMTAATETGSMEAICCSVESSGGYNPRGVINSVDRGSLVTVNTTEVVILALRTQSGFERVTLNPLSIQTFVNTNDTVVFRGYIGKSSALTGATFNAVQYPDASTNRSVMEQALSATGIVYDDMLGLPFIHRHKNDASSDSSFFTSFQNALMPGREINSSPDVIVVTAESAAGNADVSCTISIQEWY